MFKIIIWFANFVQKPIVHLFIHNEMTFCRLDGLSCALSIILIATCVCKNAVRYGNKAELFSKP